ncbi:MAG: SDR family NAD(P)-dependent oxidoreductase [Alphaproteobacteria bacterium]|nr:SDR family NAD(P)-dependent oxidoreductase [Alphaproteobacteria bacterium]
MKLRDRVALVTGASRGIGRAVAKLFATQGAHVLLLARTIGALEEVDDEIQQAGGTATLVPLDLLDLAGIDRLAQPILERFRRLDILVANAGMLGRLTPLQQFPPDLWEKTFTLNVHANWRLIRALDPLLRASPSGRAIFVTSGITRHLPAYWGAYAASKAALEAMVATYAAETRKSNLRVNLVNPGPTRTRMRAEAFPGEDPESLPPPERVAEAFLPLADAGCRLHGEWVAVDEWLAGRSARRH